MQKLRRVPSGIEGLDKILDGGFVEGAAYIIRGDPGAGKTILSNQIAFSQAADGAKILYVTLLAEAHERLFQSLSALAFYDGEKVGQDIVYLSVFQALCTDGLDAVVRLIRNETRRHNASLLVFDGLLNARDHADTDLDVKTFVAEIQNQAAFVGCTVLFLASTRVDNTSPEHTMVDGVIDLRNEVFGARAVRRLQVRKSRGTAALGGFHQFDITSRGVTVYPRLEAAVQIHDSSTLSGGQRVSTGCLDIDALMGGGLPTASVTLLAGPGGSGKTTFGLHFLSCGNPDEPALHFGFIETPERLLAKARALAIDLPRDTCFDIVWNPMAENLLDKLGHQLLAHVRQRAVRRLFIDGLGGLERAAIERSRLTEFLSTLMHQLRELGVTTVMSMDTDELTAASAHSSIEQWSPIIENQLMFSRFEAGHELCRTIAVQKMRDSNFSEKIHSLALTNKGLVLGEPLSISSSGESIMDAGKVRWP